MTNSLFEQSADMTNVTAVASFASVPDRAVALRRELGRWDLTAIGINQVLAGSRILFALGENGDLPRSFGVIHRRYRTPALAIMVTTVVSLCLALWGSFAMLAIASAVARLITYLGACAATVRLRHPHFRETIGPATFVVPMGRLVPLLAIGISLLALTSVTGQQMLASVAALAVGAVLFLANMRFARGVIRQPQAGP